MQKKTCIFIKCKTHFLKSLLGFVRKKKSKNCGLTAWVLIPHAASCDCHSRIRANCRWTPTMNFRCVLVSLSHSGVVDRLRAERLRGWTAARGVDISHTPTRVRSASTSVAAAERFMKHHRHDSTQHRSSSNQLPSMPRGSYSRTLNNLAMTRHALPVLSQDTALKNAHIQVPPKEIYARMGRTRWHTKAEAQMLPLDLLESQPLQCDSKQTQSNGRGSRQHADSRTGTPSPRITLLVSRHK